MEKSHCADTLSKTREYELHWNALFTEFKKPTDGSPPPYPFDEAALMSNARKRRRFGRNLGFLLVLGMLTAWGAYVLSGKRMAEEQLVPGAQEITVPATPPLETPNPDTGGLGPAPSGPVSYPGSRGGSGNGTGGSRGRGGGGSGIGGGSSGGSSGGRSGGKIATGTGTGTSTGTGTGIGTGGKKIGKGKISSDKPARLPDPVQPIRAKMTPETPSIIWPKYGSGPASKPRRKAIHIHRTKTNRPQATRNKPQHSSPRHSSPRHSSPQHSSPQHSSPQISSPPRFCTLQIPGWNLLELLPGLDGREELAFSQCQVFESFRVPDSVPLASIQRHAGCEPEMTIELKQSFSELSSIPTVTPQSTDGTPVVLVRVTLKTLQYQWNDLQIQLGDELEYLWQLNNPYELTSEQADVLKECSRLYVEAQFGNVASSEANLADWDLTGNHSTNRNLFSKFVNKKCHLFHDLRKPTTKLFDNSFATLTAKKSVTDLEEWIVMTKRNPRILAKTAFDRKPQFCNGGMIGNYCFCKFGYFGDNCSAMEVVHLPSVEVLTAVLPFKIESPERDPPHNPLQNPSNSEPPSSHSPWKYLPLGSTAKGGPQKLIFSMSHGMLHSIVPLQTPTYFFMGEEVKLQANEPDCQSIEYLCYTTKAHHIRKLHLLGSAVTGVTLGNNQKYPVVDSQQFRNKHVHLTSVQQLKSLKFDMQDILYTVPDHVDCVLRPGTNRFQFLQ